MKLNLIPGLLSNSGPSSSRLINLIVCFGLSVVMIRLAWGVTDISKLNWAFWAVVTTYAVYGMGVATFNKWLSIVGAKVNNTSEVTKEVKVVSSTKTTDSN